MLHSPKLYVGWDGWLERTKRGRRRRSERLKLVFLLGGVGDGMYFVCKLGRKRTQRRRNLDLSVRRHEKTALGKIPQLVSWWVGEQPAQKRIEEKRVEMVRHVSVFVASFSLVGRREEDE